MSNTTPPFHRLLTFFSSLNPHNTPTVSTPIIRLTDSLRGNLSLGLDFPVALAVALGRHLFLRNTPAPLSLDIDVAKVAWKTTPLHDVRVDAGRAYTCGELVDEVRRQKGVMASFDAAGVWALAADVKTGRVSGEDVVSFQEGRLLGEVQRRRRDRAQVLPLWRGGPIWVGGHSWAVDRFFGVKVYRTDEEGKRD